MSSCGLMWCGLRCEVIWLPDPLRYGIHREEVRLRGNYKCLHLCLGLGRLFLYVVPSLLCFVVFRRSWELGVPRTALTFTIPHQPTKVGDSSRKREHGALKKLDFNCFYLTWQLNCTTKIDIGLLGIESCIGSAARLWTMYIPHVHHVMTLTNITSSPEIW